MRGELHLESSVVSLRHLNDELKVPYQERLTSDTAVIQLDLEEAQFARPNNRHDSSAIWSTE